MMPDIYALALIRRHGIADAREMTLSVMNEI